MDDAISVADGNRKQCARKAREVRNTRRAIQRNIHSVDFNGVHALAEEGVDQATDIQKEGGRLHNMVIENLLAAKGERNRAKLHRLAELLERLNNGLMTLSGDRKGAVLEVDGRPIDRFVSELDDAVMHAAFGTLRDTVRQKGEIRLSDLLTRAAAAGNGDRFPVAVAMAVFQCLVDRRVSEKHRVRVELSDLDERIAVDLSAGRRYRGHELRLAFWASGGRGR